MHRQCVIVVQLCLLLGLLTLGVKTDSIGVRFCHEDKVDDHYAGLLAHFNASSRVIKDGIKDAQLNGEFTCTCTITADEDIALLYVWSKVAAISQDCNKHINVNTDADSVKFSGCWDSPKESLSQIPAGQQIRLILKTSTEQLHDDDYAIYIHVAPETGTKLTLSCQLPEPSVSIAITTDTTMDTFIALSNITANVTTTSTVPIVQTSRKKAVVVGVAVTSGLIVLALISCLAFCIVRRFRRKNQPKDDEVNVGCRTDENSGFKHALSRKMTTFYNKIRVDRPLPSIPKSIRRLKQRPLPIDLRELRQSGVYNSIKETSHPIETNDSSSHLDAHKAVVMSQGSGAGVMNSLDRLKVHALALNKNKLKNEAIVKYPLSAKSTQSDVKYPLSAKSTQSDGAENEPIVKYPLSAKSTQSDGADAVATKEAKDIAHKMCCRENDYEEPACYITPVGEPIDDAIESNCYMNTVQKVDHGFRKFDQNHLKTPGGGIQKESLKIIGKSGTSERLCSVSLFSGVSTPVNCVDRGDLDNSNFYVHPGKVALVETCDYSAKVYENLAFETHEQTGELVTTENTRVQGSNDEGHVVKMPVVTVDSCGYVPMGEMNRDATSCGSSASVITPDLMLLAVSGHCNSESDTCYSEDDEVSSPFASTSFETLQTGSHVSSSDVLSIPARKSKRLDSGYQSDTSKCITMRNATPDDLFPNLIQFRGIDASLKRSAPLANPDGNHWRGKVKVKRYIRPKAAQTDISP